MTPLNAVGAEQSQKNFQISMPPVLVAEIEALARAEGKTIDEIAQNAVQKYLKDRRWQQLISYGRGHANRLGLKSGDVPRLIAEVRRDAYSDANRTPIPTKREHRFRRSVSIL